MLLVRQQGPVRKARNYSTRWTLHGHEPRDIFRSCSQHEEQDIGIKCNVFRIDFLKISREKNVKLTKLIVFTICDEKKKSEKKNSTSWNDFTIERSILEGNLRSWSFYKDNETSRKKCQDGTFVNIINRTCNLWIILMNFLILVRHSLF